MRFRLIPSDDKFFGLFTEAAVNAADCARRLRDLVEDFGDVDAKHALVEECEARCDELTDQILGSIRVIPRRALDLGYPFRFREIEPALRDLV